MLPPLVDIHRKASLTHFHGGFDLGAGLLASAQLRERDSHGAGFVSSPEKLEVCKGVRQTRTEIHQEQSPSEYVSAGKQL